MKIAILGAGQLAQMMAQAGPALGIEVGFLAPEQEPCAAPFGRHWQAAYDDREAIAELVEWADAITYESENVPTALVEQLASQLPTYPPLAALSAARDRMAEKQLCRRLGVATADFVGIDSVADLAPALAELGYPAILKTRSEGYDGKGQVWLRSADDIAVAAPQADAVPCVLEAVVGFDREISIIAARATDGSVSCFPVSENIHREGILRLSLNRANDPQQAAAEAMIKALLSELDYVGVLALELFDVGGELRVNEMAPRVHNTGHWTPVGAASSQFQAHLLAVAGRPLPATGWRSDAAMINIIGTQPEPEQVAAIPGATLHDYGKSARPGRKLGHINLVLEQAASAAERLARVRAALRAVGESTIAEQLTEQWVTPLSREHR